MKIIKMIKAVLILLTFFQLNVYSSQKHVPTDEEEKAAFTQQLVKEINHWLSLWQTRVKKDYFVSATAKSSKGEIKVYFKAKPIYVKQEITEQYIIMRSCYSFSSHRFKSNQFDDKISVIILYKDKEISGSDGDKAWFKIPKK